MEYVGFLKVKDLKKIFTAYNWKVSGGKADLILRVYAIFSCVTSRSAATSDSPTFCVVDTVS